MEEVVNGTDVLIMISRLSSPRVNSEIGSFRTGQKYPGPCK